MNCLMPSIEHRQSKSSSSMPSSWTMNLTARGGRSFRVGATPRAEICCRCASIHRRSSSVLMPAARAIWSLLFTFIVGESFNAAKIRLFSYKTIYIYIYIAERKPNETQRNPRKPTYPHLFPRKPTETHCAGTGLSYLCSAIGVRPWSLVWVALRSPLDVPYRAAQNSGVGSGDYGL